MAKYSIKEREDGAYLFRGNSIYAPAPKELQEAEAILEVNEESYKEFVDVKILNGDQEKVVRVQYTGRKSPVVDTKKATSSIRKTIELRKQASNSKRQKTLLESRRRTKPEKLRDWINERRKETKSKFIR